MNSVVVEEHPSHTSWARVARPLAGVLATYFVAAYILAPAVWHRVESHHKLLGDTFPRITATKAGIPGDPLNLVVLGSEEDVQRSMLAAGWFPADPITLASSLRIAADTVLREPDPNAPVSSLFLWGHKQDLAFEQPVGHDPRRRHHVRFWRAPPRAVARDTTDQAVDQEFWKPLAGKTLWAAGATYDERVGLSHTTGQITHHIGPDVDKERDNVIETLEKAGRVAKLEWMDNFNPHHDGRNGGGDPYHTDGRLPLVVLKPEASKPAEAKPADAGKPAGSPAPAP